MEEFFISLAHSNICFLKNLVSDILSELNEHKDAFQALYFMMVGVFGLIGLYFIRKRTKWLEVSSLAASDQAKLAESTHINDQFIKSVEQLGDTKAEIKLGGVYGLEQVARSDKFYNQVVELLSAYVRIKAVQPQGSDVNNDKLHEEIQAILNILGRINRKDFAPLNLNGAYLKGYTFKGNFAGILLKEANLTKTNCSDANFTEANLTDAILIDSNCSNTDFSKADVSRARFSGGTSCKGAKFSKAICIQSDFSKAICNDAYFMGAKLGETNFKETECKNIYFSNVIDDGSSYIMDFNGAIIEGACFENVDKERIKGLITT